MKKIALLIPVALLLALFVVSCEKNDNNKGVLNLSITDAPIDSDGIEGVYITFTEIQYHTSQNNWQVFEEFEGPKTYNLLELTRGETDLLGSFELEAGTYTQLRFMLDAPVSGSGTQSNPGCYVKFEDGSTQDLFVPSGAQTGYKAVGAFQVPANGTVDVTADFDVRKSVIKTGSGKYILKPTIRLIVDNQAGRIKGDVSNIPEGKGVVVYAYEEGAYEETEADDPGEEETRFPNAVTSDKVCDQNSYHLAFIAPGIYDLVVTATVEGEFEEVLGIIEGVEVESKKATNVPIDIDELLTD